MKKFFDGLWVSNPRYALKTSCTPSRATKKFFAYNLCQADVQKQNERQFCLPAARPPKERGERHVFPFSGLRHRPCLATQKTQGNLLTQARKRGLGVFFLAAAFYGRAAPGERETKSPHQSLTLTDMLVPYKMRQYTKYLYFPIVKTYWSRL